jgi:hypothetical protein
MTWTHLAWCDKCGVQEEIRSGIRYVYRLNDGVEFVSIGATIGCVTCGGFRNCEMFPSESYFAEKLETLKTRGIDLNILEEKSRFLRCHFDPEAELAREIHETRTMLDWVKCRRSPPRCLDCGTTVYPDYGGESERRLSHPGCGGG